jgi:hypothetical protein
MIEIESGIPVPAKQKGTGRAPKYPVRRLTVGDSFFVPGKTTGDLGLHRFKPSQFTTRIVTKNGERGVRVWRIA